jgi:hypothetical protein
MRCRGLTQRGWSSLLPAEGSVNNTTFVVDGYKPPGGANMNLATATQLIGNFFPAMEIPLLRGRLFSEGDRHGSQLVVIVNHGLANSSGLVRIRSGSGYASVRQRRRRRG